MKVEIWVSFFWIGDIWIADLNILTCCLEFDIKTGILRNVVFIIDGVELSEIKQEKW